MSSINLKTVVVKNENVKESLFELFSSVDADFNGENGEDYLWDCAKENGFESNLEYELKNAKEKYGDNLEEVIKEVISSAEVTWGGYYSDWETNILKINEGFIVSIATM